MIVIRVSKSQGELGNSAPCRYCIDMMEKLGVRKIYHSNENGDIVFKRTSEANDTHYSFGFLELLRNSTNFTDNVYWNSIKEHTKKERREYFYKMLKTKKIKDTSWQ